MHNWFPVDWSDRDRGAPLSKGSVQEGCLVCPYHGWQFEGDGACYSTPGLNCHSTKEIHRAPAYKAEEKYGLIWVCLSSNSESTIPQITIKQNEKRFQFDVLVNSLMKDVIENALDPLHTHFVHPSLFQIEFQTTRQERLMINGFLLPVNEQCSKLFLISLTDAPISGFLFKTLVKPLFVVCNETG